MKNEDSRAKDFARQLTKKMWRDIITISVVVYAILVFITYSLDGFFSFGTLSKALGGTGALMFASSFSLGGIAYYWDFLDRKVAYRKYFGLMGFWYALMYSVSLLFVDPQKYFFGFFENFWSTDFILGMSAMAVFTMMAVISNKRAMQWLGSHRWRMLLRLGYPAWFLLALRAYSLEKELWATYFQTWDGFPPPRMLLSLLVVAVLLFRISVDITKKIRESKQEMDVSKK